MREIKFRAWAQYSKEMFFPNDEFFIIEGKLDPIPNTILMQFTGLLDKNGKEIYFGDILDYEDMDEKDGVHYIAEVVETINNGAGVCIDYVVSDLWEDENVHKFEIIGNIYENPELLTKKED